jgi:hypothetical protein
VITWGGMLNAEPEPWKDFMIASAPLRALEATLMAPITNVSGRMRTGGDSFGSYHTTPTISQCIPVA